MPQVQANLAHGGRHHNIFKDSMIQRSLLVRGTAAIKRIEAEEINVNRLTVTGDVLTGVRSDTPALASLQNGSKLMTENAVKGAVDLYDITTPLSNYSTTAEMNLAIALGNNNLLGTVLIATGNYPVTNLKTVQLNTAFAGSLIGTLTGTASGNLTQAQGDAQYCTKANEWLSKARIEVWYSDSTNNWSSTAQQATTLGGVIGALGLDSALFYTYNTSPGNPTTGLYYSSSVPPVINTGFADLKVDDKSFNSNFVVRWTLSTYVYYTGTYSFQLTANDTAKLLIRDTNGSATPTTVVGDFASIGTITLDTGKLYEIQVCWHESSGLQTCKLEWKRPIDTTYTVFAPLLPSPDFQYYQPSYTCVRATSYWQGHYTITFGTICRPQSNNYTIVLTCERPQPPTTYPANPMSATYHTRTSTGFGVICHSSLGGLGTGGRGNVDFQDCRFDFCCISRGRVFCHGSVSATGVPDEEQNYG